MQRKPQRSRPKVRCEVARSWRRGGALRETTRRICAHRSSRTVSGVNGATLAPPARFRAMGTDVEVLAVGADAARWRRSARWPPTRWKRARRGGRRFRPDQRALPAQRRRRRAGRGVDRHVRADHACRRRVARHAVGGTTRPCSPRSKRRATTATSTRSLARAPRRPRRRRGVPGCDGVELDDLVSAVRLPPGVALDLGGIGKGAAADEVSAELLGAGVPGVRGVLVNLGGDLRARGDAPAAARLGGRRRRSARHRPHRRCSRSARARSPRARSCGGRGPAAIVTLHHLIDPRTGEPARVGAGVGDGGGGRGVAGRGAGQGGVRRRSRRGRALIVSDAGATGPASSPTTATSSSSPDWQPPSVLDLASDGACRTHEEHSDGRDAAETARDERWYLPKYDTVEEERLHRKQRLAAGFRHLRQVRVRGGRRRPHHRPRPRAARPLLGEPVRDELQPHPRVRPPPRELAAARSSRARAA